MLLISIVWYHVSCHVNRGFNTRFVCYMFQFVYVPFAGRRWTLVYCWYGWMITVTSSSVGRISEWEGLRSRCRMGWGGDVPLPTGGWAHAPSPEKFCIFCIKITGLWCTLTPFWSNFITGWKWTTMRKMVHFAMLQTTKYYFSSVA